MARKNTRNARGGGTIRQRKDGRWEARYTVGKDPGTGKQIQRSIYGDTQAEVRKALQQCTTAIDEGLYMEPSKITVSAWLKIWLEEYNAHLKPLTILSYSTIIKAHICPAVGSIRLSLLAAPHIQALYNQKIKEGLSPKTIKNMHGVIHKALEQAAAIGYIRTNPATACKIPRSKRKEIKPLDEKQLVQFMKALKSDIYKNLFIIDAFTGLRRGEITGLTWDCINFQTGTLHIYRQLQRQSGEYVFETLKNDRSRTIALAPFVLKLFQEQRRTQNEWRLKAGDTWKNKNNLIFTTQDGANLCPGTIWKHFKEIAKKIGVPDARFHDLRHSYAVAALRSGDNIKTVQENLGHHTAAFTLDVYGHVTEQMKRESAARMESFIQNLNGQKNL